MADVARDNKESEGVTDSQRIVSNPNPVAYLSLQICLTIDYYIQVALTFFVTLGFLYKVYLFTYPLHLALIEFFGLIILQLAQFMRLFVGSKGNKTENTTVMFMFICLTFVTCIGAAYFAQF